MGMQPRKMWVAMGSHIFTKLLFKLEKIAQEKGLFLFQSRRCKYETGQICQAMLFRNWNTEKRNKIVQEILKNKNKIMKFTLPDLETNYSLNNQWNWYWR